MEPEIDSLLLKEWVVFCARAGDLIWMEGRHWFVCAPIGLRFEARPPGEKGCPQAVRVAVPFPS